MPVTVFYWSCPLLILILSKQNVNTEFLGVIIDESITWNKSMELVGNEISKTIGMQYRASYYLDKNSRQSIYFSFIHNYENYCNIAWPSTTRIKIDKILKKQKHTVCIIYNKGKFTHSKLLMNALNVCQINIFQVSKFTYKAKPNLSPRVF